MDRLRRAAPEEALPEESDNDCAARLPAISSMKRPVFIRRAQLLVGVGYLTLPLATVSRWDREIAAFSA
jgi:hypothetical protein